MSNYIERINRKTEREMESWALESAILGEPTLEELLALLSAEELIELGGED